MKQFFIDFFKKYKVKIIWFSILRILDFLQCLFNPYAIAKIINIITKDPTNWKDASFWAILFLVNNTTEDIVRLRGKLGLEKIAIRLKLSLTTFFSQKTKIRKNKKTGEAVQAIKGASDDIQSLINFYKDNILQLPVNLIIIPLILFKANTDYLVLLLMYMFLYFIIELFAVPIYNRKLQKFFQANEIFWGTAYRKTPEIWREREDGKIFTQKMNQEEKNLYKADTDAISANTWRWTFLQCLSSVTIGLGILFALHKIVNNSAPIGDLILVSSYLSQTQGTLNIITSTITRFFQTKISLKRLNKAVKIRY
ncbi:MAG: ABC transporter ATP-binding protein [Candidatus Pacebacteria bacterium]|nr:ABC transporter ATP-binding protein [Candidatus Paceibacterota bacterium]